MVLAVSAIIVASGIAWGCLRIAAAVDALKTEVARNRTLTVLGAFLPAVSAATSDPQAILTWEPLARSARQLFPDEFSQLDRAWGSAFPLGSDRIQAAHARWTADWLAWEKTHDAQYKLKAAELEEEISRSGGSSMLRAQLDSIEREKLERYQKRYEEYVRVGKALQALAT